MKCTLLFLLSTAAAFAASVSRETFPSSNTQTIDAASYKAAANGTLSLADLSGKPHGAHQKRDAGNVFLCVAANWQQYCVYITNAGPNECVNLASDLDQIRTSRAPCLPNCSPSLGIAVGPILSPGVADLSQLFNIGHGQIVNGFNDVLSSYSPFSDAPSFHSFSSLRLGLAPVRPTGRPSQKRPSLSTGRAHPSVKIISKVARRTGPVRRRVTAVFDG
ncbi:hypothetical protein B0H10DRAFT_2238148 [Mycena sp. CBHHK59/15]|nr:hypothetical protein B0H10DRAFT_2238148 [Mycena sp. CBHHK59/15]